MSHKAPQSLADLIGRPGSALNELATRAERSLDLAATLRQGLPESLAGGLDAASLHPDGTLVVTATSPAWAARLRFEEARLLALCAGRDPPAMRLRVRVTAPAAG